MASSTAAAVTSMMTSIVPSATSSAPPSSTTASAPPAASTTGAGQTSEDGGSGRPLLFFVALGFGVVFTNLWIIVGIKYCFRYNRRMRAGLLNDENGEPIDLNTMPGHRPRRRREKKLMSMDEVNERFPLTRYKMWKSAREQEGLAPEGGVTAPTSRPASVHAASAAAEGRASVESKKSAIVETVPATEPMTPLHAPEDAATVSKGVDASSNATPAVATAAAPVAATVPAASEKEPAAVHNEHVTQTRTNESELEDDEEPDPIHEPINPHLAGFYPEEAPAGDSCAICIDVLEDDDEVRGLTCGHAFHAGCLDPWLTARRACCPLCKADYYVPKPRPEGETGPEQPEGSRLAVISTRHGGAMMMPHFPGRTRRMLFGGPANPPRIRSTSTTSRPAAYDPQAMQQPGTSMGARAMHWFRTIPENLPSIGMRPAQGARAAQSTATDLEAGQTARA